MPHDPYGDAADPRAAQDAAWREIVENFGDRAVIDDDLGTSDQAASDTSAEGPSTSTATPVSRPEPVPAPVARVEPAEEHFVPPPAPPVPTAEPRRLLAWLGLFGVPLIVLGLILVCVPVPSWLGLILMVWFVGGFVFLVASMRSGPRDDNDDGAVV